MKARVKWLEDRAFVGETESGHRVVLGTAFGEDGRKPGPSPMELVLIGTGGCSAWDVVNILAKGRQAVEDCVVELDSDRAAEEPRVFTRIHMHFVVKGRGLDPAKVQRAIDAVAGEILLGLGDAGQDRHASPTTSRSSTPPLRRVAQAGAASSPRRRAAASAASIVAGVADQRRPRPVRQQLAPERRRGAGQVDRHALPPRLQRQPLDHVGGRGVHQRHPGEVDDQHPVLVADPVERRARPPTPRRRTSPR